MLMGFSSVAPLSTRSHSVTSGSPDRSGIMGWSTSSMSPRGPVDLFDTLRRGIHRQVERQFQDRLHLISAKRNISKVISVTFLHFMVKFPVRHTSMKKF